MALLDDLMAQLRSQGQQSGGTQSSTKLADRFDSFFQSNPDFRDFLFRGNRGSLNIEGKPTPLSTLLAQAGIPELFSRAGFARDASPLAFGQLNEILFNQGRTDPRIMNFQLSQIDRGTQANRDTIQEELSRRGLGNFIGGQALAQAAGSAGEATKAQVRLADEQQRFARQTQGLDLFRQLIQAPSTDALALALGQFNANASRDDAASARKSAGLLELGKLLFGLGGSGGGGN